MTSTIDVGSQGRVATTYAGMPTRETAFERLSRKLIEHTGADVRRDGAQYKALCPAHEDNDPSLGIKELPDRVLIYCRAYCNTADVLAALGMTDGDLYNEPKQQTRPERSRVVAEYPYRNANGELVYTVKRFEPSRDGKKRKSFLPFLPGAARSGLGNNITRIPYRLPQLLEAVRAGHTIHLPEGEKDCDTLVRLGHVATTNAMGAGHWPSEWATYLIGADVVIYADRDKNEQGRKRARDISESLQGKARSVRVVEAAFGKDVTDHIQAGLGMDDFRAVDLDAPAEPTPTPEVAESDEWPDEIPNDMDEQVNSLIAEMLDSNDLDNLPTLDPLVQDVLFMDTVTRIYGPSGVFKSFITLSLAGSVGTGLPWYGKRVRQGLVIYLVAEGARGMGKRKRAWEQHYGRRMTGVKFLPRPVQALEDEWIVLINACRRLEPVLIIIDTQARVTVGVEENSNTEMGRVVDRMEQLRMKTGACVLVVHHAGHEQSERGRGASAVKGAMQTELGVTRAGKGLDSKVTVKTGKQKDDEELGDHVFALKQIKLNGEAKEDGSPVTSLVLVLENFGSKPAPTAPEPGSALWIADRLDQENIPPSYGRDRLRMECARLGIEAGTSKLEEVARIRKNRPQNLPSNLPRSIFNYSEETAPEGRAGAGIPAGETRPAGPGAGTGQASPDLPAPSSPLREGAGGAGGFSESYSKDGKLGICRACGGEMTLLTPDQTLHPMCEEEH